MPIQTSVLAAVPPHAAFLSLDLAPGATAREALAQLAALTAPDWRVVGLGPGFVAKLGARIDGLRPMPELSGPGAPTPSTPADLWLRVDGDDPGVVLHRERATLAALPAFVVADRVLGFLHRDSRDLTGYVDGTENPTGAKAKRVAGRAGAGAGLDGGAVVAVQRWLHDLAAFDAMDRRTQDHTIGRERDSNDELDDAPPTAHVKRTAQESFEPEAFVLRRSMPWRDARGAGLVFVSFSATLDPFEALLRRMVGAEDGRIDALYRFTRPVTGATFWCPPAKRGRLDLTAVQA